MEKRKRVCCSLLLLMLLAAAAPASEISDVVTLDMLKPKGVYYEATIPDTLDLAERARLAVHGLTAFLDQESNYAPWGHFSVDSSKPALLDRRGGWPNWGKIVEATVKMRLISGSTEGLDDQLKSILGMINRLPPPARGANHGYVPEARAMIAFNWIYQLNPTPALRDLIVSYGEAFKKAVMNEGDVSYFTKAKDEGPPFYFTGSQFVDGTSARALAIWGLTDHNPSCVALAERVARGLMNDARIWTAEVEPKAMVGSDRGHFRGHMHAAVSGLMGMIYAAEANHDTQMMEFVRSAYEYQRNFGMARVGLFGEGCTTGDMTQTAIKLSEAGVGDYWEDVDCYVRNHLIEIQLTDPVFLRQALANMNGKYAEGYKPEDRDYTDALNRVIGTVTDDATHLTKTPQISAVSTICAPGNVIAGMYLAWEAIVSCKDGTAKVNLLLNRASPWLDVDSYLPYEGKVVIHNKTAHRLMVRIPLWVNKAAVKIKVGNRTATYFWAGNYLVLGSIKPKNLITITFPMVTTIEKYTLKWKTSEFWLEITDPGANWSNPNPIVYTMTFKGNTLVDVSPRDREPGIPLYQRNAMRDGAAALMTKVKRFVADIWTQSSAAAWMLE